MNGALADRLIAVTAGRIAERSDELSRLDAIAGDGDHGVNMATAFAAAAEQLSTSPSTSPSDAFLVTGAAFSETVGGASGALLGAFFTTLAKALADSQQAEVAVFVAGLEKGATRMTRIAKAERGQKTMLDALFPAIEAAGSEAGNGSSLRATLEAAAAAARTGADSTINMTPTAGRARFASEQSLGNPDPGATTIAIVFEAWAEAMREEVAP